MIVPHYDAILHALGTSRKELAKKDQVQIPVTLLNFLLLQMLKETEFNEVQYLKKNPDVAEAVKRRQVRSGREHYLAAGFLEGRRGALPSVDEEWYRKANADVAIAVRKGELASGADHYEMVGAAECRPPAKEYELACFEWKVALGKAVKRTSAPKPEQAKPRR